MDLERLNFLFKAAGITKKELAKLLDINAQSIYAGYNGELGHQRQKHLDTLVGNIFRI